MLPLGRLRTSSGPNGSAGFRQEVLVRLDQTGGGITSPRVEKGDSHAKSAICVRRASDCRNDRLDRRRDGGRSDSRSTRYIVLYEPNVLARGTEGPRSSRPAAASCGPTARSAWPRSFPRTRASAPRPLALRSSTASRATFRSARLARRYGRRSRGAAAYAQACSPGYEGGSAERGDWQRASTATTWPSHWLLCSGTCG